MKCAISARKSRARSRNRSDITAKTMSAARIIHRQYNDTGSTRGWRRHVTLASTIQRAFSLPPLAVSFSSLGLRAAIGRTRGKNLWAFSRVPGSCPFAQAVPLTLRVAQVACPDAQRIVIMRYCVVSLISHRDLNIN